MVSASTGEPVLDQLAEIKRYLREACGKGKELDADYQQPDLEPAPNADDVMARPNPPVPPAEPELFGMDPEPAEAALAAFNAAQADYERQQREYRADVSLYHADVSRHDRQKKAHLDSIKARQAWQTGQDEAIGIFRSFHTKHHYNLIEQTEPYKSVRTLANAVKAAETVYCVQDRTGLQTLNWFERAMKTAIPAVEGDSLVAWTNFHTEWKKCDATSEILTNRFDAEEEGLGAKAVPILLSELVSWSIIRSVPSEGNSALFHRLQPIKTRLEAEGCRAYNDHHGVLEEVAKVIRLTENEQESDTPRVSAKTGKVPDQPRPKLTPEGLKLTMGITGLHESPCAIHPAATHKHKLIECAKFIVLANAGDLVEISRLIHKARYSKSDNSDKRKNKSAWKPGSAKRAKNNERSTEKQVFYFNPTTTTKANSFSKRRRTQDPNNETERAIAAVFSTTQCVEDGRPMVVRGMRVKTNKNTLIDTGASYCMVKNKSSFLPGTYTELENQYVYLGDDTPIEIAGRGNIAIKITPSEVRTIKDVLHVPALADNLASISHILAETNDEVTFSKNKVHLRVRDTNRSIEIGRRMGNLYYMTIGEPEEKGSTFAAKTALSKDETEVPSRGPSKRTSYMTWHVKLGHVNPTKVMKTLRDAGIGFDFSKENTTCQICQRIAMRRLPYSGSATRPTKILQKICEDTFELEVPTLEGHRYCSYLVDVATYKKWLIFLKSKADAPKEIIKLLKTLEVQHKSVVETVQTDGGELNCQEFREFCNNHEPNVIDFRMSPPHTQALNGFVERHIGIDKDRAGCMLAQANLPGRFIKYALEYAVYVGNLVHNPLLNKTPMEALTGRKPDQKHYKALHLFGCLVFSFVPKGLRGKRLGAYQKAEPGIFLGYEGKGIVRVWKHRTKAVHNEYHVAFCETEFPGLKLEDRHLNPLLNQIDWEEKNDLSQPAIARGQEEEDHEQEISKPETQTVQEEQDDDFLYDGTIQLNPDENGIKLSFSIRIYSPIMTLPTCRWTPT